MMRRKLGILFLIGITVLAGTQEAARQFDGLKSSLKNFTRASLWSGLIVYAQPVSDGKLPTPQIYYLMPASQPQPAAPAAQQAILADNAATTAKPEARNNHGGEAGAAAAANPEAVTLVATREAEDAAESELMLQRRLPLDLVASHFVAAKVAPKPDKVRVYEEVAKNETHAARKFKHDADTAARVFVKELKDFDVEKLVVETERIVAAHERLEHLKLKPFVETENLHGRMDVRIVRRAPRHDHERIRVNAPITLTRGIALPAMSSIGCEKTRVTPKAAPAPPAPPIAKTSVRSAGEPSVVSELPVAPYAVGNSWSLNCDTEPEQK